ncbi:hypothetical protein C8034_v010204 [Colletotrichum sidae]|uniref:Uncharacterized protein n=1 Tax=Colletotrichum sidae TaxID=1347389 RepID=A0A4R8TEJ4_9PEZI|nr:hypothetical protein C8034_v010204 [Colletotrichum sidae]
MVLAARGDVALGLRLAESEQAASEWHLACHSANQQSKMGMHGMGKVFWGRAKTGFQRSMGLRQKSIFESWAFMEAFLVCGFLAGGLLTQRQPVKRGGKQAQKRGQGGEKDRELKHRWNGNRRSIDPSTASKRSKIRLAVSKANKVDSHRPPQVIVFESNTVSSTALFASSQPDR